MSLFQFGVQSNSCPPFPKSARLDIHTYVCRVQAGIGSLKNWTRSRFTDEQIFDAMRGPNPCCSNANCNAYPIVNLKILIGFEGNDEENALEINKLIDVCFTPKLRHTEQNNFWNHCMSILRFTRLVEKIPSIFFCSIR